MFYLKDGYPLFFVKKCTAFSWFSLINSLKNWYKTLVRTRFGEIVQTLCNSSFIWSLDANPPSCVRGRLVIIFLTLYTS